MFREASTSLLCFCFWSHWILYTFALHFLHRVQLSSLPPGVRKGGFYVRCAHNKRINMYLKTGYRDSYYVILSKLICRG